MTSTEQHRENEQRRMADTVREWENVKADAQIKLAGIIIATCTFFGSIIMYMSVTAAKDVVKPTADQVLINRTEIGQIKSNINEIKDGQKETIRLLRELSKK
jgi:hypothetical protein